MQLCLNVGVLGRKQLPEPLVHLPADVKQRRRQLVRRDRLEQIADDVVVDCLARVLEAVIAAENDNLRCGAHLPHPPRKFQTRDHRHPDIGQNQVRLKRFNQIQSLHTVFRFAHNLKPRVCPTHALNNCLSLILLVIHYKDGIMQRHVLL